LTDEQRLAKFKSIADDLISTNRPGVKGRRRSLGPCATLEDVFALRDYFLRYVAQNYPGVRFGIAWNGEGTGGTTNRRPRAYLAASVSGSSIILANA
jgi:hypothetical protein